MSDVPITSVIREIPTFNIKDPQIAKAMRDMYRDLATAINNLSALVAYPGINGSFTTGGKTYTVTNGIITSIV